MISTNIIRESEVVFCCHCVESIEWKKGKFRRRATQERQPHFELTHFLKSYCLCTTYIYREREGERVCVDTNNTNVRVTSTNKLLGLDQILPSVR